MPTVTVGFKDKVNRKRKWKHKQMENNCKEVTDLFGSDSHDFLSYILNTALADCGCLSQLTCSYSSVNMGIQVNGIHIKSNAPGNL